MLKWADLVEWFSWRTMLGGRTWPAEVAVINAAGVENRCQVVNVSRHRIHILVAVNVTAGEVLVLHVRNRTLKGKVVYSRPLGGPHLVALAGPPYRFQVKEAKRAERRDEPRLRTHEAITLKVISLRHSESIRGWLVDISQSGIGLVLESFVPPSEYVEIRAGSMIAFGEVRYCQSRGTRQFRAGVRADETLLMDLRDLHRSFAADVVTRVFVRLPSTLMQALHSMTLRLKSKHRSERSV